MEIKYEVSVKVGEEIHKFDVIAPIPKDESNLNDVIDEQILDALYDQIAYVIQSDFQKRVEDHKNSPKSIK